MRHPGRRVRARGLPRLARLRIAGFPPSCTGIWDRTRKNFTAASLLGTGTSDQPAKLETSWRRLPQGECPGSHRVFVVPQHTSRIPSFPRGPLHASANLLPVAPRKRGGPGWDRPVAGHVSPHGADVD